MPNEVTTPSATASTPQAAISTDPAPAAAAPPAAFDWSKAGLSPGHLNLVTERGWKSPDEVMTSYRHLESATGVPLEQLIKLPSQKDAADPKAWDPIYDKLGRPPSADKYVLPLPEGDKGEFANAVKPWMHAAGLSQAQATALATKWNEHITTTQKASQVATEDKNLKDISQLKQEWGSEFENRSKLVDRAADAFGVSQAQLDALKSSLGPKQAMEFLFNIGSKVAVEDTTVPGMGQQPGFRGMTPEAAQAEIAKLKADPDFARMHESKDPKTRSEARAQMSRLQQIAYSGVTPIYATSAAPRPATR